MLEYLVGSLFVFVVNDEIFMYAGMHIQAVLMSLDLLKMIVTLIFQSQCQ